MARPLVKPAGNSSHAHWSDLANAWTFHYTGNTSGDVDDIKGSNHLTKVGSPTLSDTLGLDMSNSTDYTDLDSTITTVDGPYSIMVRTKKDNDSDAAGMVFGNTTLATDNWYVDDGDNLDIRADQDWFQRFSIAQDITVRRDYCLTVSAESGGSRTGKLYYKLPSESTWTLFGTTSTETDPFNMSIASIGHGHSTTGIGFIGEIEYLFFFDGAELTAANLDDEFDDPYNVVYDNSFNERKRKALLGILPVADGSFDEKDRHQFTSGYFRVVDGGGGGGGGSDKEGRINLGGGIGL